MSFEDCLRQGLIKKDAASHGKTAGSLAVAETFLKQAKGNLGMKYYIAAELLAYNSSFHSGRALLFSKGYREKSHACLIVALKSLFREDPGLSEMLRVFDQLRLSRHNVQYGGLHVDKAMAEAAVDFASRFLSAARKTVEK